MALSPGELLRALNLKQQANAPLLPEYRLCMQVIPASHTHQCTVGIQSIKDNAENSQAILFGKIERHVIKVYK